MQDVDCATTYLLVIEHREALELLDLLELFFRQVFLDLTSDARLLERQIQAPVIDARLGVLARRHSVEHHLVQLFTIHNDWEKVRLTLRLGLRLLEVHEARKTRPPELPVRDRIVRPSVFSAALQLIIAARRHIRGERRRIIRTRFDENHLQVRLRESKPHARRLKRQKPAQRAVQEKLRPQVQKRSREQRDADENSPDSVIPRHDHHVIIARRVRRRDAFTASRALHSRHHRRRRDNRTRTRRRQRRQSLIDRDGRLLMRHHHVNRRRSLRDDAATGRHARDGRHTSRRHHRIRRRRVRGHVRPSVACQCDAHNSSKFD